MHHAASLTPVRKTLTIPSADGFAFAVPWQPSTENSTPKVAAEIC